MNFQITIIGMGVISSSIGLALGAFPGDIIRIGVDRDVAILAKAKKLGVVDRTSINIPDAISDADVILLAEPLDQMLDTLSTLVPLLVEAVHLLDVSGVKVPIHQYIKNSRPDFHHHVSLTCVVNPDYLYETLSTLDDARQDLFRDGLVALSIPQGTSKDTVELASGLANLLGARTMFNHPVEADGLQAAANYLPQLMATTLMNSAAGQLGWREARRQVNPSFMLPSRSLEMMPESGSVAAEWLAEKENLIRYIDIVAAELKDIRSELEADSIEPLSKRIGMAKASYHDLKSLRTSGEPVDTGQVKLHIPSSAEAFREMIGFGRSRKKPD